MFGVGGAEWLYIAGAVLALLVLPAVIVFGAGYFTGKKAGEQRWRVGEDVSAAERHMHDGSTPAGDAAHPAEDAESDSADE